MEETTILPATDNTSDRPRMNITLNFYEVSPQMCIKVENDSRDAKIKALMKEIEIRTAIEETHYQERMKLIEIIKNLVGAKGKVTYNHYPFAGQIPE